MPMYVVQRVMVEDLPNKIKQARIADGRSVQVLATKAGISSAYWYELEGKKKSWVSLEIIRSIEKVLGIDFGISFKESI